MEWLDRHLYPQMCAFPADERRDALHKARGGAFDVVELVGIATGLIVTTAATRAGFAGLDGVQRVAAILLVFVTALPILCMLVGPFLVRRTRRNLDSLLAARQ